MNTETPSNGRTTIDYQSKETVSTQTETTGSTGTIIYNDKNERVGAKFKYSDGEATEYGYGDPHGGIEQPKQP